MMVLSTHTHFFIESHAFFGLIVIRCTSLAKLAEYDAFAIDVASLAAFVNALRLFFVSREGGWRDDRILSNIVER